ncbi:MAG: hypothetical protein JSW67_11765 [Candidatus Latescibacterota bacterium]|nr:MAG: hypothetical protein JSW67_11765 [Candidatus Latescibacterota bacterium]
MLRDRRLAPLLMVLVGAACHVQVARAQLQTPTNFDVVRDAARLASEELVESLHDANVFAPVVLRSVGDHDGGFLVESTLSSVLTQAGYVVRTRPDSTGPLLEFEVVDLGVAYTRVWRHAWLGDKKVERQARARVFARLIDQENANIVWAQQGEGKVVDEVPHEELEDLEEQGGAPYLQATLPPRRWNRVVEPIVVTGIVVGLIVLFFSNQDTSN